MKKTLNENQRIAVNHDSGPMLVLAGPGSGKTTVILCRVRRLLAEKSIKGKILVVTFTKAAATEMKERFLKSGLGGGVEFSTFHSIFFRMLRRSYGYEATQILAEDEKRRGLLSLLAEKNWEIHDPEEYISDFMLQASFMNNELLSLSEFIPTDTDVGEFRELYRAYRQYKERHHKIDFDDMLLQCFELLSADQQALDFWRKCYPYIMVDEFQDVNRVQYECLRLLAAPENNLLVVGDDDQSIYGFRGARPDFLLEFRQHFPASGQVILDTNYRSTDRILALAGRMIGKNALRFEKNIAGVRGKGEKTSFFLAEDTLGEAEIVAEKISALLEEGIAQEEIAVIYRTNLQGGAFARALYHKGIPYVLRGGSGNIYDHWIAKDLLAYLYLAESEDSDGALRRIINKPKRYIGKDLMEEAERMPYTLLRSLFVCPSLKKWQAEQLENLQKDLQQIRKRKPLEAIQYIRRVLGYDEYLEEYAAYRKASGQVLMEIADEIADTAKEAQNTEAFRNILEEMTRQIAETAKQKDNQKRGVVLVTMHGVKGLEFEAVFIPSLMEGIVPHEKSGEKGLEEERRLFYVALTRAKEGLCMSAAKNRHGKKMEFSRFLGEIGMDLSVIMKEKD